MKGGPLGPPFADPGLTFLGLACLGLTFLCLTCLSLACLSLASLSGAVLVWSVYIRAQRTSAAKLELVSTTPDANSSASTSRRKAF